MHLGPWGPDFDESALDGSIITQSVLQEATPSVFGHVTVDVRPRILPRSRMGCRRDAGHAEDVLQRRALMIIHTTFAG